MPEPVTAAAGIAAVGAIGGAVISANAAKKASKAQTKAGNQQIALQRDIFEEAKRNQAPFIEAGNTALDALMFELGLGPRPDIGGSTSYSVGGRDFGTLEEAQAYARANRAGQFRASAPAITTNTVPGTPYGGFELTPDYTFGLNEGIRAVDASAAAGGTLNSGATLAALTKYGQDYASTRRGEYLNRLGGLVGGGQTAVQSINQSGNVYGQGVGDALASIGNARAAGAIGVGNAISGGLNNLSTIAGLYAGGAGGAPTLATKPTLNF